jgi:hypothetical protein
MSNIQGSRNFFANSAIIALTSIADPVASSTIVFRPEPAVKSKGPPTMAFDEAPKQRQPIVVASQFKLVFLGVLVLTVVAGLVSVIMSMSIASLTQPEQTTLEMMQSTWKMGFGAFLGLIGGKATN